MAFLLCVGFCGYGVMRKLGCGVGCPLTGRYVFGGIFSFIDSLQVWILLKKRN